MPRRPDPDSPTRARLLRAASAEFAARGFDGTTVDRIAHRARVNKAMVYYHYAGKVALYRAVVGDLFGAVAAATALVRDTGGDPADQLRRFIETVAREAGARPHFPVIWLREVAEAGRHLDANIVGDMTRVAGVLAAILEDGRRAGRFRATHPAVAQIGIVAPLLFFAASAPVRERLADRGAWRPTTGPGVDDMVAYVREATLAVLERKRPARRPAKAASGHAETRRRRSKR